MAKLDQLARPVMRRSAGLEPHRARRQRSENSSSLLRLIGLATTTHPKHQRNGLERRAWPDRAQRSRQRTMRMLGGLSANGPSCSPIVSASRTESAPFWRPLASTTIIRFFKAEDMTAPTTRATPKIALDQRAASSHDTARSRCDLLTPLTSNATPLPLQRIALTRS